MTNKDLYNFQTTAKIVNKYFKIEAENELSLSFKGYGETVNKYFSLQDNNFGDIYSLIGECNFWENYISEISNIIQYKYMQYIDELEILKSDFDRYIPDFELDDKIDKLKIKIKHFLNFTKQLKAQKNFFNKAYFHCYNLYCKSLESSKKAFN